MEQVRSCLMLIFFSSCRLAISLSRAAKNSSFVSLLPHGTANIAARIVAVVVVGGSEGDAVGGGGDGDGDDGNDGDEYLLLLCRDGNSDVVCEFSRSLVAARTRVDLIIRLSRYGDGGGTGVRVLLLC